MMSSHPISQGLEKGDDDVLSATTGTQGDTSNLAQQVNSTWTATSNFTPPGPGITFDSSKSGMQGDPCIAWDPSCICHWCPVLQMFFYRAACRENSEGNKQVCPRTPGEDSTRSVVKDGEVGANYHQRNVLVPGGSSSDGRHQKTISLALLEHRPVTADPFLWNTVFTGQLPPARPLSAFHQRCKS